MDRILDRPRQIHGTPNKPSNHTHGSCWVFKQASKLNAEEKEKGSQSENDDEEPRPPNTGGHKKFPPHVKTANMIYTNHIPKRERKRALRDVYAIEPVAPKFNPSSSCLITFDRRDHPTSICHGGSAALVLYTSYNSFKGSFGGLDPCWIDAHFVHCILIEQVEVVATVHEDSCKVESINYWVEDQCG